MVLFELVIALLIAGALLTVWSGRLGVPYPVVRAIADAFLADVVARAPAPRFRIASRP